MLHVSTLARVSTVFLLSALGPVRAQSLSTNLLQNPSNEQAIVGEGIPGWVEETGTEWTQGSGVPAKDGAYYFRAGPVKLGVLRQDVDVSGFQASIDAGQQPFTFLGYVQSNAQSPPDTSRFVVMYLDAAGNALSTFDTGELGYSGNWFPETDTRVAPIHTCTVRVKLIATRHTGTNNGGWFDDLSLVAEPWSNLGGGLSGILGIPVLAGNGTLEPGTAGSLELSQAAHTGFTNLLVSLDYAPTPFKGGLVATVPLSLQLLMPAFTGSWSLPWSDWPNGLPSGFELYFQVVVADASVVQGFAISNVLRATQP